MAIVGASRSLGGVRAIAAALAFFTVLLAGLCDAPAANQSVPANSRRGPLVLGILQEDHQRIATLLAEVTPNTKAYLIVDVPRDRIHPLERTRQKRLDQEFLGPVPTVVSEGLRRLTERTESDCALPSNGNCRLAWETRWLLMMTYAGVVDADDSELSSVALARGPAAYRAALRILPSAEKRCWAETQLLLSGSLRSLGWLTGEQPWRESLVAAKLGLSVFTRETWPDQWAFGQLMLGHTLQLQGERETNLTHLNAAVQAFERALSALSRDTTPFLWAKTRSARGEVLRRLAARTNDLARMKEALAEHETALGVLTPETAPGSWAVAQGGYAQAIVEIGDVEHSPALLSKGIQAYEKVLKLPPEVLDARSRGAFRLNLSAALTRLAVLTTDEKLGLRAQSEAEAALTLYSRVLAPLLWVRAQETLGHALNTVAQFDPSDETLQRLLGVRLLVLTNLDRQTAPRQWAEAHYSLAVTLGELGDWQRQGFHLKQADSYFARASSALAKALQVYTKRTSPYDWARTKRQAGRTLSRRGELGRSYFLKQAVDLLQQSLTVFKREEYPEDWAEAQLSLGLVYWHMSGNERYRQSLKPAERALAAASEHFTKAGSTHKAAIARFNLAMVHVFSPKVCQGLEEAIALETDVVGNPTLSSKVQELFAEMSKNSSLTPERCPNVPRRWWKGHPAAKQQPPVVVDPFRKR